MSGHNSCAPKVLSSRRICLLASVAVGSCLPLNAFADSQLSNGVVAAVDRGEISDAGLSKDVDTVVVTARRREESLADVPLAVSALSGRVAETEHLDRVGDYAAKLPNFSALQQNPRVSALLIRGLGGNANSDGSESGVGLIVDDVFFSHVAFSWLDFVDIESVQVARGPQGTLLGKNTTIGAVVITTQKPRFDEDANLAFTFGNDARRSVRLNATGPIVSDKLAYRLTFYGDTSDGWIQNNATDDRYLNVNRFGLRGQLLYRSASGAENRLIAERYQTEEWNNFYPPTDDVNQFVNGARRAGSWSNKLIDRFGYTPSFDRRNNANFDTQQTLSQSITGVSNSYSTDIGTHRLISVTAWRNVSFIPRNDSDGTPFPIFRAGYDLDVEQVSQELRLASPDEGQITYQIGLFALQTEISSNLRTIFYSDASKFFLGAAVPSIAHNGVESSQLGRTDVRSYAGFGQATWSFNEKASLTAGLRYSWERRAASNTATRIGGASLDGPLAALAPFRAAVSPVFEVADTKERGGWSWLVNPAYRLTDTTLLYASVSYGEKSGAANLTATPGTPVITDPETSISYEAGFRTNLLDKRLTLTANIYQNDIEGFQGSQQDPTSSVARVYLANVGKVRLKGLEGEASFKLTDNWDASFSGAYNNARYLSYKNAPPPIEYAFAGGPLSLDYSGKPIPNVAKWSGQIGLNYDRDLGDGRSVFGYINDRWRSTTRQVNPVSNYGAQPAYNILNAGVGFRWQDERYSLQIWGKNLTDEDYAVAAGAPSNSGPQISVLGDPRQYGLTLTAKTR